MPDLTTIASSAGFATICSAILTFVARNWLSERLKQSIQNEYAEKLEIHKSNLKAQHEIAIEILRSDFARYQAISATASASFHEAHRIGLERRLAAVGNLWEIFLLVDKATPLLVFVQDIHTVDDYPSLFTNPNYTSMFAKVSMNQFNRNLGDSSHVADSLRPFVGEYLWQLYFAYRALNGRLALLLEFGKVPENRKHWTRDSGVRQMLEAVLTAREIDDVYKVGLGSCRRMCDLIKQKYLVTASKIISGEASASDGLVQAMKIAESVATVSRNPEAE